jgi:hypothetical protein
MKLHLFVLSLVTVVLSACAPKPHAGPRAPAAITPPTQPTKSPVTPSSEPEFKQELSLFDGQTLTGWKVLDFGGNGGADIENGAIKLHMGADLTGIVWTNTGVLPKQNYEIELEAMKVAGTDFFCGLTVPVGTNFCSLILGGWGGSVVGISSLDGMDASENDTSTSRAFEKNRWYRIRLQVTSKEIRTWIDDSKVIDVSIEGRKVAMRFGEIERCTPLGLSTWQTTALYRNIKIKPLPPSN